MGEHILDLAWARDPRGVEPEADAISIGAEETFAEDIGSKAALAPRLLDVAERVGRRTRRAGVMGHTVTLKIKYADFKLITRSRTSRSPTDLTAELFERARALLDEKVDLSRGPVRLVGIQLSNLIGVEDYQGNLFEPEARKRETRLERKIDAVREKFGKDALVRASVHELDEAGAGQNVDRVEEG